MTTPLTHTDLGPVSLLAPAEPTRDVRATYGHLWQWTGDGEELYTLSVAVRETRLGTPTGVRHHLSWEIDQLPGAAASDDDGAPAPLAIVVDGSLGTAAADVLARADGARVRHRLLVTTDGDHMHVVRVVVPDTDAGRELAERVASSLRVQSWSRSA